MTRRPRSLIHQPMLHVYTRGSDRQDIFYNDEDRQYLIDRLADAVTRFNIEVHAYCLMDNHLHLQVDRRHGDISAAMQWLLFQHARRINHTTDRTGPLFTSRFCTVEVENDSQALQLSRYISLNPLAFLERNQLVEYPWASLGAYVGEHDRPDWLITDFVLGLHGQDADAYRRFVETPQPADKPDGRQSGPWNAPTVDDVDLAVELATSCHSGTLRIPTPRLVNPMRDAAAMLSIRFRVADTNTLAAHYGHQSPSALRRSARRAIARSAREPHFAALIARIEELLNAA